MHFANLQDGRLQKWREVLFDTAQDSRCTLDAPVGRTDRALCRHNERIFADAMFLAAENKAAIDFAAGKLNFERETIEESFQILRAEDVLAKVQPEVSLCRVRILTQRTR